MKKNILALAVLVSSSYAMAQTEFDALKYSLTDINGTARYMSMAGAFGALGGDASAIKDNPAGLGIYRKSEIVGSYNSSNQNTSTNWQFISNNSWGNSTQKNELERNRVSNFSAVFASTKLNSSSNSYDLVSSNWSFSYNRLKDFGRRTSLKSGISNSSMSDYIAYFSEGLSEADLFYDKNTEDINKLFNNPNIPTLAVYGFQGVLMEDQNGDKKWNSIISSSVIPTYSLAENGYIDEFSISWGGNFSNSFYLGASLNYQNLNYSAAATYKENYGSQGDMSIGDTIYSKGHGFSLNIGTIVSLSENFRVGLSVHSPTILNMSEEYYSTLKYKLSPTATEQTIVGPGLLNHYQLQTPMQVNASIAYITPQGLLSAEYVYKNYTGSRLMNDNGYLDAYSDENAGMIDALRDTRTIKLGGEYKLTRNLSLRAGGAYTSKANNSDAEKFLQWNTKRADTEYFIHNNTKYLTAGIGYREASWFIDFACTNRVTDETFYPYRSSQLNYHTVPASVITTNNNYILTLGYRF